MRLINNETVQEKRRNNSSEISAHQPGNERESEVQQVPPLHVAKSRDRGNPALIGHVTIRKLG